ncbi:MAG: enoyl-CoA hydratase/isomerase family protein [Planctomycetota bacterium]|jgi:enoyl-CoA hydratase/carnithine racemase
MDLVRMEHRDGVARLTLCRGVTNPLSLELLRELAGHLEVAMLDEDVRALVLTSESDKFFSIGFDLPRLLELDREGFAEFYRTYNRRSMDLYVFPKPSVAAITGHAVAGGCILALTCDERYIASGRKLMGLNEVKLGVPVPYPGDCILRQIVGSRPAREIMEGGEFLPAEDLRRTFFRWAWSTACSRRKRWCRPPSKGQRRWARFRRTRSRSSSGTGRRTSSPRCGRTPRSRSGSSWTAGSSRRRGGF